VTAVATKDNTRSPLFDISNHVCNITCGFVSHHKPRLLAVFIIVSTSMLDDSFEEELGYLENASAFYDDVIEAGMPMDPPLFRPIATSRKETVTTRALDLKTAQIKDQVELIYARPREGEVPRQAYYIEGEYKRENKLGLVHVWKRCRLANRFACPEEDVEWEIQACNMAVQCVLWGDYALTRKHCLHRRTEDARTAISTMQHVSSIIGSHANLRGIADVLEDDMQWWIIMPFSARDDLFTLVQKSIFNDTTARFWFRQILEVQQ
jgi:hypothetical protein